MIVKRKLTKTRYITGFDGIRALAVIGVILYHLFPAILKGGYLGVPIFFTLSGYLITDLLLQEWAANGAINIRHFYIRRMKRLYPGLVMMLLLSITYIVFFQQNLLNNLRGVFFSSLLYYNNWWQIFNNLSYFDRFTLQSPFTHIWSLAVEAQNYLIWPTIFIFLKEKVSSNRKISAIVLALAGFSALLMALLYAPQTDPSRVYYGTDTRIFSIFLGNALAFIWPSTRLKYEIPKQAQRWLNGIGIGSFVVICSAFLFLNDHYAFLYRGGMFLVSVFSCLLIAVVAHPGASLNRWFTNPVFTWIGKRSYGIYLYQFPIMIFYEAKITNINDHLFLHSFLELLLILGISELSYRYIEVPFRKKTYHFTKQTLQHFIKSTWLTKEKLVFVMAILCSAFTITGLILAPSNTMTEDQKQLQETIRQNQKKAEKRKEEQNQENADTAAEETQQPEKYGLTASELKKASEMEITAFGDSVILDAAAGLQEIFPKLLVDGAVGRQLYESPDLIEQLKKENLLKQTVLIGLGTNGSFTEAQFDEMMQAIGSSRKVFWINVRVPTRRWQNEVNRMLNEMQQKYKQLTVIDWFTYSNEHEDWFYEDRVHPNPQGQVKYAELIAQQMLK